MRVLRHLASCTRHTGLAIGDDAVLLNESCLEGGVEGHRYGRRVAAGVRDQLFSPDLVAEQLRQAVDGLLVQSGIEEGVAVPLLIFLLALETKIRAEIDEHLSLCVALGGQLLGQAVRQGGKDHVALFHDLFLFAADRLAHLIIGRIDLRKALPFKAH